MAILFTAGVATATHIYPWLYELPVVTITSGICAPFSNTCIDTDGPDIFHQGFLTVASNLGSGPFCVGNFAEYSIGNDVLEFHCGNGIIGQQGVLYAAQIPCPLGYTSYQGRCAGGPLLVNHICGNGVCQNVGVSLLVRDNYLLVNDNGINHLVRIIGTSDPVTVVIEVDGIAQAFQTGQTPTFNGLPFQVVSVIHFTNNQQFSGANLRFGENIASCPSDCINHTICVNSTCMLMPGPGPGFNQCSPVGAFCNVSTATAAPNGTNSTVTVQPNATLPDLTIFSFLAGGINYNSTSNQTNQTNGTTVQVTLTAIFRNIGNAAAGPSTTRISVASAGTTVGTFNLFGPGLNPGAQTTVSATFTVAAPATYSATATADVSNAVAESNENNNAATISFTV